MAISIIRNIKGCLFSPVAAFRSSEQAGVTSAFLYFASLLVFHEAFSLLLATTLMHGIPIGSRVIGGAAWMGLWGAFLGPIISALGILALGGAALHVGVFLMGGRRGLAMTWRVIMYAATPWLLFGWIPLIGSIAVFWMLGNKVIGMRELHRISTARSAGAVVFAVIIGLVLLLVSLSRIA